MGRCNPIVYPPQCITDPKVQVTSLPIGNTCSKPIFVNVCNPTELSVGTSCSDPIFARICNVVGSPIEVSTRGNYTNNLTPPGPYHEQVLTALANATAPTWTEGNEVLLSVDLDGNLRTLATVTLDQGASCGDPLYVNVCNAQNTAVATASDPSYSEGDAVPLSVDLDGNLRTLATVTFSIGSSCLDPLFTEVCDLLNTQGSTTAGQSGPLIQGAVTTAAPSYTTGQTRPLSLDTAGALRVTGTVAASVIGTVVTTAAGPIPHDDPGTGTNPLLIGGYASAAAPTSVSTDGDAVRAWFLRNGAQATVLTAAGALIGGDAANGLDVDVTRLPALVAGTAIIGKVGIDQTTPGTTNGVNVTSFGAGAQNVATDNGASNSGTLRVTVANNSTGVLASITSLSLSQGSATAAQTGPLIQGAVTTAAPSYTTAQTSPLSLTTTGLLRVDASGSTIGMSLASGSVASGAYSANSISSGAYAAGSISAGAIASGPSSLVHLEDDASANLDAGVGCLAVRKATPANTSGSDGDYEFLQMSAGRLWANATVEGQAAQGASVTGNPVLNGLEARDTLGTAVSTGQVVRQIANRYGANLVSSMPPSHVSSNGTPVTTTTTNIVAAPSAGSHTRIVRFHISNGGSTSCWVALRDGAAGTRYYNSYLPQNGIVSLNLNSSGPLDLTTATRLDLVLSAAGSVEYQVDYFTVAD